MKRVAFAVAAVRLAGISAAPAQARVPKQARVPDSISVAAVGDTILGNTPRLPSRPARYFRGVRRQLRGDV